MKAVLPANRHPAGLRAAGDAGLRQYRESGKTRPGGALTERRVSGLGYQLPDANRVREAVEVFEMNAEDFPGSANASDSLARMVNGDRELVIENHRRSVEPNPGNSSVIEMLKKLGSNH